MVAFQQFVVREEYTDAMLEGSLTAFTVNMGLIVCNINRIWVYLCDMPFNYVLPLHGQTRRVTVVRKCRTAAGKPRRSVLRPRDHGTKENKHV